MDNHSYDTNSAYGGGYGADTVVIGGGDAPRCISAASVETGFEMTADVHALSDRIMTAAKRSQPAGRQKPPAKKNGAAAIARPGHKVKKSALAGKKGKKSAAVKTKAVLPVVEDDSYAPVAAKPKVRRVPPNRKRTGGKQHRTSSVVLAVALSIAVILLGAVVYEAFRMMSIVNSVNYVHSGIQFDKTEVLVSESETQQFVSHTDETKNILLCGIDIDKYGSSRSDSMIILTIDHVHKKIKMTSLMRDMYLQIPGHRQNKLNAAFSYGGGDLLLKTIYHNFGMRIDRYACIDYAVFASVVDNLGGVEIEVEEMELEQFNKYVGGGKKNKLSKGGTYNLNGQQALSYCRIRKVGTDTARTARQRKVLKEIMKKCRTLSPLKAQNILSVAAPHITTNMSRDELTSLLLEGLSSRDYETMGLRIPMDGAWTDKQADGKWYVEVDLNKNARYLNQFIYGDNETAQALSDKQQKSDDKRTANARANYNKKKK